MADFFSREQVLGGLPARQATAVLFAIKSRTAYLMTQSRQAVARFATPKTSELLERDFLQALAQGRDLPLRPTIQDLERYAPEWAALVPANPGVQAAIAHMLAKEYIFAYQQVPRLRRALALDDETVKEAYERQNLRPLQGIYALHSPLKERWRWLWAGLAQRLEEISPFWTAFALTLTEIVGASILALPIALAGLGPLAGVVLLLVLGVVNVMTLASVTEAVTRNGNMRYGRTFLGRLVGDYLGGVGTLILTLALLLLLPLIFITYYVGVATTLAQATGISNLVWPAFLFLVGFYYLRRESLDATIASALLIGAINIGLIVILSLLTLPHVKLENLLYIQLPFGGDQPFSPDILKLVFGIILAAYFGHTTVGNMAKVVLRRDPSGRTMLRGNVAAMLAAMGLYILWVIAVNGAVAPAVLADTSGTALIPLAAAVGPSVYIFGSAFVILGMGMGSIHYALAIFNQTREWLPGRRVGRAWEMVLSKRGRFWIGVAPVALLVLLIEWLLWTDRVSFAEPLGFLGVVTMAVVGGIFPMLMLVASRRNGEYVPVPVWRFLGHPLVVGGIYLIFLASLILHGLVIWQDPFQRSIALLAGAIMVVIPFLFLRRGAFVRRAILELRADQNPTRPAMLNMVVEGRSLPVRACLVYADPEENREIAAGEVPDFKSLGSIKVHLPATRATQLKVWLHQLTPEGESEGLPASVSVAWVDRKREYELSSANGQVTLPFSGEACEIEMAFRRESVSGQWSDLQGLSS